MYISLTQAKLHLEKLVSRALRGEEIIICRLGQASRSPRGFLLRETRQKEIPARSGRLGWQNF
jgi:hypothetical protein